MNAQQRRRAKRGLQNHGLEVVRLVESRVQPVLSDLNQSAKGLHQHGYHDDARRVEDLRRDIELRLVKAVDEILEAYDV